VTGPHGENPFERAIVEHLVEEGGWALGDAKDWDVEAALRPGDLFAFLEETGPEIWARLRKDHGEALEDRLLEALRKSLDSPRIGCLEVVRRGFKIHGQRIPCAIWAPTHGKNPLAWERFRSNRLVVTRQVPLGEGKSVDLALSVNEIPVATAELENALTGQSVEDGERQFRRRDPRHPLFRFDARALVHFAVDTERVSMTTRLQGKATRFLHFDQGRPDGSAGNPDRKDGKHRAAYLWEEVWARESFLDILRRFLHRRRGEKDPETGKRAPDQLIFPRYHQLDAVRKLSAAAAADGPGGSYLVQHSAGSGKSNTIAWLAHRLTSLHDAEDRKVFDSVVVVTDRRVLDSQLQDCIHQIEHRAGVVEPIRKDSGQLAEALRVGKAIIVTTLQKFPFVTETIGDLPDRRYAILVDEAHSSQTGDSAAQMKAVLAPKDLEDAARQEAEAAGEDPEVPRSEAARQLARFMSLHPYNLAQKTQVIVEQARANPLENFELAMKSRIESLMLDRLDENEEIVSRYLDDEEFRAVAFRLLVAQIYQEVRGEMAAEPAP